MFWSEGVFYDVSTQSNNTKKALSLAPAGMKHSVEGKEMLKMMSLSDCRNETLG